MTGWAQKEIALQARCSRAGRTPHQAGATPFVSGDPLPNAAPKTGKTNESDGQQHPGARLGDPGHGVADVGAQEDAVFGRVRKVGIDEEMRVRAHHAAVEVGACEGPARLDLKVYALVKRRPVVTYAVPDRAST